MAGDDQALIDDHLVDTVAREWALAVVRCCFVPMRMVDIEQLLRELSRQVLAAAAADPPDAEAVREVGRALVRAHFTEPEVLEATLLVLGRHLPAGPKAATVQATLSAGYTQALRNRTLVEQERLARAIIDARSEAERVARESEARFRAIFAGAAIGICIADVRGRIVEVNQTLADMLGYTTEEMRGMRLSDLRHPQDPPDLVREYVRVVRGTLDQFRVEKCYYRRDGTEVWGDGTVSVVRDETGRPRFTVAMVNNVTDRRHLAAQLRHVTMHDPLTGLPNRAVFADRLAAAVAEPGTGRLGVCYLDLDGFKELNDRLGHHIGDEVLVAVAGRLAACAAELGHLAVRMGGDEFLILVPRSTGLPQLIELAERLLATVAEPVQVAGHRLRITASIGVVERPAAGAEPTDVLRAADVALYRAKAKGRGRWASHDPKRLAEQIARYALAADLPDAVERDEFTVVYQPIVSLPDLSLVGVEALVRWCHPHLGELPPNRFIDLAEESGLIVPIGRRVLREACHQVAAWRERYPASDLIASVNIAAAQTREPSFVDDVEEILAETGLKPSRLQLELTESTLMDTNGRPIEALRSLANTGVRVAIDDFGTGYSSLAYLRSLPVHALKLAGPFVSGLTGSVPSTDEQIVDALIRLAHALGVTVTAEGVESQAQVDRLRTIGCDYGQGFYLGRPGSPTQIARLIRNV